MRSRSAKAFIGTDSERDTALVFLDDRGRERAKFGLWYGAYTNRLEVAEDKASGRHRVPSAEHQHHANRVDVAVRPLRHQPFHRLLNAKNRVARGRQRERQIIITVVK